MIFWTHVVLMYFGYDAGTDLALHSTADTRLWSVRVGRPASAGKSPEGFYANLCARSTIFLQLNSNNFPSRTMLRGSHVQIWVNSGCLSLEVRHKLLSGILENAFVTVPDDICYPSC